MKTKVQNQYTSLHTIRKIAYLRSSGRVFTNGISSQYDESAPPGLSSILTAKQLDKYLIYMRQLNIKLQQYWPCNFAYYCGYFCAPLTFGISLCLPLICIREAEEVLKRQISKINRDILNDKKLEMRLHKQCCDSALVIQEIDFNEFQIKEGTV